MTIDDLTLYFKSDEDFALPLFEHLLALSKDEETLRAIIGAYVDRVDPAEAEAWMDLQLED